VYNSTNVLKTNLEMMSQIRSEMLKIFEIDQNLVIIILRTAYKQLMRGIPNNLHDNPVVQRLGIALPTGYSGKQGDRVSSQEVQTLCSTYLKGIRKLLGVAFSMNNWG
jgi:hypothetical protein